MICVRGQKRFSAREGEAKRAVFRVTYFRFSNAFTVVSLANELTKLTTSARMQGRRKCAAMLALQCWMDGQPAHREEKISETGDHSAQSQHLQGELA